LILVCPPQFPASPLASPAPGSSSARLDLGHQPIKKPSKLFFSKTFFLKQFMQQRTKEPWENLPRVDFYQMDMDALLRYKKRFQLTIPATATRSELATACARHFSTIGDLDEFETITYFAYSLRNQGNLLKLPPPIPTSTPSAFTHPAEDVEMQDSIK
jgi:hypothetical protein